MNDNNHDNRKLGGMGWQPDLPDFRDFTAQTPEVKTVLSKSRLLKTKAATLPATVDLREWCSPIEDQGDLGSCTANAGVGLLEYYERRACGHHLDASRLFLYKATRNLLGWTGDTGAYLRTTMKAMALFGAPPEQYWRYNIAAFDNEPPAFCYAFAQNYQSLKYYRLDPPDSSPSEVLGCIKKYLAARLPSMFGFTVYSSFPFIGAGTGDIPFPQPGENVLGGHAVDAVGYDNAKKIGDNKGALLIRNSWGTAWGENGYGWLPYKYVEVGLAEDFWSLVRSEYIDTALFE
jgi:C1A family cysteine protease